MMYFICAFMKNYIGVLKANRNIKQTLAYEYLRLLQEPQRRQGWWVGPSMPSPGPAQRRLLQALLPPCRQMLQDRLVLIVPLKNVGCRKPGNYF